MKTKKILALMLAVLMFCTVLAACASDTTSSVPADSSSTPVDSEPASEPAEDDTEESEDTNEITTQASYPGTPGTDTFVMNIGTEPPSLNSTIMTDTVSFSVLRHITENLVMLDETDNVIPGVAESWELSDDGLEYTFALREGMTWTNGEPVTANDFVFAFTTLLDPATASEYAYFGYIIKNGEAFNTGAADASELGVAANGDYELVVTLETPVAYALNMFAFGVFAPVNQKFYEEVGADAYNSDVGNMCTNGAFVMTEWQHESKIVLEKNEDFWNSSEVAIERIEMVMINDSNAVVNAFRAGEIDMAGLTGDQATEFANEGFPVHQYADGATFYLQFNTLEPGLNNAKVRTALGLAIDKEIFINSILKNNSAPAEGFVTPAVTGLTTSFQDEVRAHLGAAPQIASSDVERAKALLEEGLAEEGLTIDDLTLSMICDDSDTAVMIAAFIQEQILTGLDIEVEIESMPFKSRLERQTAKDFSLMFAGWGPDYNDPNTFLDMWITDGGNNATSWSSAEYDELIASAATELDPAVRMEKFYEAERILAEENPMYPIYWRIRDYVVSDKVNGGYRTMLQDMNFRYASLG